MQSSPPQRAWDPPSPATTKYSIDLAALEELDSRSGASTPLPGQQVDRILSEDIDGPSDFTLNMEKWMRAGGAPLRRGSAAKERLPNVRESKTERNDAIEMVDKVQTGDLANAHVEDGREHANDPGVEDDTLSLGEPDVEQQTPRADGGNAPLQPTVEDYYSELHILSATPIPSRTASSLQRDTQAMAKEPRSSLGRVSGPTLSPLRTPAPVKRPASSVYSGDFSALDQQIQELTARCHQLEKLNATLNEKLEAERRSREAENQALKVKLTEAARREKDLIEVKANREDFRRHFDELKESLRASERQQTMHKQELQRLQDDHGLEMQELRNELDNTKGEHEEEILAMELELEIQRRGRADFEEESRMMREELDERITEVEKLKMEIQQGEDLREQIKEQLRLATMEHEKLRSAVVPTQTPDAEKTEQKTIHNLQRQLKEARQQLRDEKAATERLEAALPTIDDMNEELGLVRAQLNEAKIERDDLQDRLTAETEVKDALQERLEEMDNVNKLVDSKIAETIKKREAHWRAVLAEKQEMHDIIGKALLRAWGKLEGGRTFPDGSQEYFFKYPPKEERERLAREKKKQRDSLHPPSPEKVKKEKSSKLREQRRDKLKEMQEIEFRRKEMEVVMGGKKGSVRFAL